MKRSDLLKKEIEKLSVEYTQALKAEMLDIAANSAVIEKLNRDESLIYTGTYFWWVSKNGNLLEICSDDQYSAMLVLENEGFVEKIETKWKN